MPRAWILVANRTGARILERVGRSTELRLIEELDHPQGRLKDSEIDADRPGRSRDPMGQGWHGLEHEQSAHDRVSADFARLLADRMLAGRNGNRFDEIVLVAEPRFLGMLRSALDRVSADMVEKSIAKDFTHVETRDLLAFLEPALKAS